MSTNSIVVGMIFCGLTIAASSHRRGSNASTTPVLGSIVQNGKFAAAMPAFVFALNGVDTLPLGSATMPHLGPWRAPRLLDSPGLADSREKQAQSHGQWISAERGRTFRSCGWIESRCANRDFESADRPRCYESQSSRVACMQPLHRLIHVARHRQRQHAQRIVDRAQHRRLVVAPRLAEHPAGDLVLVTRMADADAQPVEPAVVQQGQRCRANRSGHRGRRRISSAHCRADRSSSSCTTSICSNARSSSTAMPP